MATGTIRADEGRVQRQVGLRVGYVPQKLNIDPALPMRVERLLDLTAKVSPDENKQALAAVGSPHLETAFVQDLSGGEVQRIESVNGFVACQLNDCGDNEVSIFMLCTQCERAHEFTDNSINSRLQSLSNDRGFQVAHKVIEITGLCADCQTAQTAAPKH